MKAKLLYLVDRLKEPSTYAGIAALLVTAHVSVDPGLFKAAVDAGIGLSGLAAVLLGEKA